MMVNKMMFVLIVLYMDITGNSATIGLLCIAVVQYSNVKPKVQIT